MMLKWLVDCRVEVNCPLMGPGPASGGPSVGVFLKDPSPYLREFRRKTRKTLNGEVDKRDRGLNLTPPVYKLWSETEKNNVLFISIFSLLNFKIFMWFNLRLKRNYENVWIKRDAEQVEQNIPTWQNDFKCFKMSKNHSVYFQYMHTLLPEFHNFLFIE